MPIISSSESGNHITTIIFNSVEIAALTHMLSVAEFPGDEQTSNALSILEELEYGLGITFNKNHQV